MKYPLGFPVVKNALWTTGKPYLLSFGARIYTMKEVQYHNFLFGSTICRLYSRNLFMRSTCVVYCSCYYNVETASTQCFCKRLICHSSIIYAPEGLKPSSKLKETVHALKEKAKEEMIESPSPDKQMEKKKPKKPILQRIKDELLHYYHGFKLLFLNMGVSRRLLTKSLRGGKLTRRESKLLSRTLGDMFRLVPFSVFIVVPFLELALPLYLKFFPGMLPSTFETRDQKESKMKKKFKVQLEMASFLQSTLLGMAARSKDHVSQEAIKFSDFFDKVRTAGGVVTSDEIMKFSKLFRDEITLDNLHRPQLMAICRVLDIRPIGTTKFLRYQLGLKLRKLQADDMLIQKEGINSLSEDELQSACQARGMPAVGVSQDRLKQQLAQWLDLSVEKKVPPSLLVLSQAFMFPSNTPTEEKLAATIQALPKEVETATKAEIQNVCGKMDFKTEIALVKEEMQKIDEEQKETVKPKPVQPPKDAGVKRKEHHQEKAQPIDPVASKTKEDEVVKTEELAVLGGVLERKMRLEKEKLKELKQKMKEYEEDSKELKEMLTTIQGTDVHETTAAKMLKKKLKKMIHYLSEALPRLEKELEEKKQFLKDIRSSSGRKGTSLERSEYIKIDEFKEELQKLPHIRGISHDKLIEIIHKLDRDKNGYVRAESLKKLIEIIGDEEAGLSTKQINEVIELLDKEDIIESDLEIIKALSKGDAVSELKKELEKRREQIIEELKQEKKESDLKKKDEKNLKSKSGKKSEPD